jgi:SAM-dependent methyltransferase
MARSAESSLTAGEHWREQLAGWAIPEHIAAAVTESPWAMPVGYFARRAQRYVDRPVGASYARAVAALDPPGSVLDVGAGAGAASLPLAARTTGLVAVDTNADMLAALRAQAGVAVRTVQGRWPDVAAGTPVADVVVCHHVFYNVPDLADFALALTAHARRRVVVELGERHPLVVLNPLWTVFHGLERPTGPTATDAVAVLREAGIDPREERWRRPPAPVAEDEDLVEMTRRRLCLPPERRDEVAEALRAQPAGGGDDLVTLWWEPQVRSRTTL